MSNDYVIKAYYYVIIQICDLAHISQKVERTKGDKRTNFSHLQSLTTDQIHTDEYTLHGSGTLESQKSAKVYTSRRHSVTPEKCHGLLDRVRWL